ncbi:hypothetical protein QQX09_04840 [Demequina sp. SYSU T00192]|uniref:SnoaL-like domain-containing protein n=1 Tax=Demequina litoralis TaxID=3051660 RepID=A0ABT8G7P9_9MICO|nr:hypothetical protein [Demequina sp. SYSU T00192]MDN4475185.1 hypothetical protein [Demequina sp. SYSU T00192]
MNTRIASVAIAATVVALASGCSAGGETQDLEAQLAEVTEQRDALQAELDAIDARYDKTVAVKAAVEDILADPESYGTPDEVADLLASYGTDDAVMDDDVFGAVGLRQAWYNTLSNQVDAEIETVQQWVDDDGSVSGSLWIWRGTNFAGEPFELVGINVDTHADDGTIENEWVAYPYPDEFVRVAIIGGGTPTTVTGEPFDE